MPRDILITRPLDSAQETAVVLEARGYVCRIEPMLVIAPLEQVTCPDPVRIEADLAACQGVVCTSAHGVRFFRDSYGLTSKPLYCVGVATACRAREAGFSDVRTVGAGGAGELFQVLSGQIQDKRAPLLHPCGRDVVDADTCGLTLWKRPLYVAHKARDFSPQGRAALESGCVGAVLFFSARTGEAFASLAEEKRLSPVLKNINALCLGHRVLKSISFLSWKGAYATQDQDMDMPAMLSLLARVQGNNM